MIYLVLHGVDEGGCSFAARPFREADPEYDDWGADYVYTIAVIGEFLQLLFSHFLHNSQVSHGDTENTEEGEKRNLLP